MLPESFSTMTSLTTLILEEGCYLTSSLRPIMGLPALEHLSVGTFDGEGGHVAGLPLESLHLTKLEVCGDFGSVPVGHPMMMRDKLR